MTLKKIFTTRAVILVAVAAMIALSIMSYRSITKLNKLSALVDHTHIVQLQIQRTYAALIDADSELKAFLITNDSSYYQTLLGDENRIRESIAVMTDLTRDNAVQADRVQSLDSLIKVRWSFMSGALDGERSTYGYYSARIEESNRALEKAIETLYTEEEKLLEERVLASSQYQSLLPVTLLAFQIAIVLLLLVSFYFVTSDLKSKEKLQYQLVQYNKELKDQRDFIQTIFENTVDAILILDHTLSVMAMNKSMERLFGSKISVGSNIAGLHPQLHGSQGMEAIQAALRGEHKHIRRYRSILQPDKYFESFFIPLRTNDHVYGAMAIHHDITEVVRITDELKSTNEKIRKSNNELEEFAYVTSHDLQEPLRKIQTFTGQATQHIDDKPALAKYLGKVLNSAERMSTLIRDILDYSRLSNEKAAFDRVDLNKVLDQIIQDFELSIEEKKATIKKAKLPIIRGSEQQFGQVFSNLMGNSLKFSRENPVIEISCAIQDGLFRIDFSDNGIGFDQAYADKIFSVFQRLHHRNEYSGTGIGLAICKRIIQNHEGTIEARSTPNKGTTITIWIPASE